MSRRKNKTEPDRQPANIADYRIIRKLGEGGMGVVYEAVDERLHRTVALKMIRDVAVDRRQRERLQREARMAAGVNHPNICHVYEIGEANGELFIAMEFLDGSALSDRIKHQVIPLGEALDIILGILSALDALHRRKIIHRDLKPSNIYLTEHGIKILDFGLARPHEINGSETCVNITQTGAIVGTPRYMAPEQWANGPLGPPTDLFALGAILYEMLTGKPAFGGATVVEVCRAIINEEPPPLSGGPEVMAIDRVIQRALAKSPEDRYPNAQTMIDAVRNRQGLADRSREAPIRTTTRLVVLPFRLLRPDEEIDFLSVSLPDAITTSLSVVDDLVIHTGAGASKGDDKTPNFKAIAAETGANVVVLGSLIRAGNQVRANCQLIEAESGTVLCSRTCQKPLGDIFQLQDELAREIVQSLSLPLAGEIKGPLQRDVPKDARVYEAYLRANQLGQNLRLLHDAKRLYLSCIERDPDYAPAWASLGRVYRVMAKYGQGEPEQDYRNAEEAFQKAFELNPDLTLAHSLYTNLEVERGRAEQSVTRLIQRAKTHAAEPDLFAGLVLACRFCGLLEASVAADRIARRLDPGIRTSVSYTYWMLGDYEKAMLYDDDDMRFVTHYSLSMLGRESEAIERLRELMDSQPPGLVATDIGGCLAGLENDRDALLRNFRILAESSFQDPEGLYFQVRSLVRVGETALALQTLERVVKGGLCCPTLLRRDRWLDPLREAPEFQRILRAAEEKHRDAAALFTGLGGEPLLGMGR